MSDRDKKEAFVTLATNDTYSLGCLVLGSSLRRVGTTRQLVVMVTTGVTNSMRTQLAQVFDLIQEVNILDSEDPINLSLLGRPDLNVTFTKLHCWRLTQFDKAVFLDADTLVLQNVDELFDREELSASPDAGWPDCFNSGVFVFKPSQETYESLLSFATSRGSFDGGDQGLLNLYFHDWATKDISKHLPFIYNVVSQAFYSYLPAFTQFKDRVKIVHFIGAVKPWHHTYNTSTNSVTPLPGTGHSQEFLQVWWKIFMEMVQPNLDPSLSIVMEEMEQDNTNTNSEESVGGLTGPSVMKVVYPYKNPEVTKVFYDTSEDSKLNIVDIEVIPRSYTELENYYAEEPLSHIDPEEPSKAMYDATWITKGWEKSHKVFDKDEKSHAVLEKDENIYEMVEKGSAPSEPKAETVEKNVECFETAIKKEVDDSSTSIPVVIKQEDNFNADSEVGLVSQMGGLSISGIGGQSPIILSDQERKLNWEKGCIDYLGQDAYENIQRKIEASMSPQSPTEPPPTEEPAPQPVKSASQPVKPTSQPVKPILQPVKPTTQPAKQAVKSSGMKITVSSKKK